MTREEFLGLEMRCARDPRDGHARSELLRAFFALGQPDDVPGSSSPLPKTSRAWRIAAITAYHKESLDVLGRCHASVLGQTIHCDHILVADGHPRPEIDSWGTTHLSLDTPSADFGDTPRRIGGQAAVTAGYDAVFYLDADNWVRPRHAESLLARHIAAGVPLCHSARTFHRPDRSLIPLLESGDNVTHVDTSCLFVAAAAFDLLSLWGTWPRELSHIGDRMLWHAARARGYANAFTGAFTTCYETTHLGNYVTIGEPPPPGARPDVDLEGLFAWHAALPVSVSDELESRWGFSVRALLRQLQRIRR